VVLIKPEVDVFNVFRLIHVAEFALRNWRATGVPIAGDKLVALNLPATVTATCAVAEVGRDVSTKDNFEIPVAAKAFFTRTQ